MARPLRIEYPGAVYHVTARGNARQQIYGDDKDHLKFLDILGDVIQRYNWICHAYCLMSNHYHLLLETLDGNLSAGMRQLGGVYTQYFNRSYSSTGHVFQGRYKAILVEREAYLLELCRYVVLNPVRAGMVKNPADYPWSSYKATIGLDRPPRLLSTDWLLEQFGPNRPAAQEAYIQFVADGIGADVWKDGQHQCLLGGRSFCDKFISGLKDRSNLKEIPRIQRYVSRPHLEDLFPTGEKLPRTTRNNRIASAALAWGYSYAEIARHIGLHYSTISIIVQKAQPDKKQG